MPAARDASAAASGQRCLTGDGSASSPNAGGAPGNGSSAVCQTRDRSAIPETRPRLLSRPVRLCTVAVLCLLLARTAAAQSAANVLVVTNDAFPQSVQIAEHYARKRVIPTAQVLHIRTQPVDEISRAVYEREIQGPIAAWLSQQNAHDRILYIVLTKGIPLRIEGSTGRGGTVASVDSELTLLYRRLSGRPVPAEGPVANAYFQPDATASSLARFSHSAYDIYLVTRLDGFTVADALALIDRGSAPVATGRVLLDQRASPTTPGNGWLLAAADRLRERGLGDRVTLETSGTILQNQQDVLGYYSWGSNDTAIAERNLDLQFVPGAIAGLFVSTDARTFAEPPAGWKFGRWEAPSTHFAGSPQSLVGDFVRAGITGMAGHVTEPFLDAAARPDVLFPAYVSGLNLAEAFYASLPYLSWQTVVVGDPLCAPFPSSSAPAAADLDPPTDKETELPEHFSKRRISAPVLAKLTPQTARRLARVDARIGRNDAVGARDALVDAAASDDVPVDALNLLAGLHERTNEPEKALPVYKRVIDRDPNNVAALNNLAYALAVRERRPEEAWPFAERALKLQPGNALIADTAAWIRHLLGDDATALKLLEPAARALPRNADVQLHAAVLLAAAGRLEEAAAALKAAQQSDKAVVNRPEFAAVQQQLGKGK